MARSLQLHSSPHCPCPFGKVYGDVCRDCKRHPDGDICLRSKRCYKVCSPSPPPPIFSVSHEARELAVFVAFQEGRYLFGNIFFNFAIDTLYIPFEEDPLISLQPGKLDQGMQIRSRLWASGQAAHIRSLAAHARIIRECYPFSDAIYYVL
jgi:hypothetical protein